MSNKLIEYILLHQLSLQQDMEDAQNHVSIEEDEYYESDSYYTGAIDALEHILKIAREFDRDYEGMVG